MVQITQNPQAGGQFCTPKSSQKLKVWAVSLSTLQEEGKGGLARARKQQIYSSLVFAQIERISSVALRSM